MRHDDMMISRGAAALLSSTLLATALLAGCSATAPAPATDPGTGPDGGATSAPVEESSGAGGGTNGADWNPTDDICGLEDDWRAISLKLDEGQGQEPPAPGFAEALALAEAFTPSPSIADDWAEVLTLLGGYVDVLATGDQAAIDTAYPEKVYLVEVRVRYNLSFLELCG